MIFYVPFQVFRRNQLKIVIAKVTIDSTRSATFPVYQVYVNVQQIETLVTKEQYSLFMRLYRAISNQSQQAKVVSLNLIIRLIYVPYIPPKKIQKDGGNMQFN
jgi:hypothetical protein